MFRRFDAEPQRVTAEQDSARQEAARLIGAARAKRILREITQDFFLDHFMTNVKLQAFDGDRRG
jgi:hypothetical protein